MDEYELYIVNEDGSKSFVDTYSTLEAATAAYELLGVEGSIEKRSSTGSQIIF